MSKPDTDPSSNTLRALAGEATPGPWGAERFFVDSTHGPVVDEATTLANAEYIAAADPQTVLELLDAVEHHNARLVRYIDSDGPVTWDDARQALYGDVLAAVRRKVERSQPGVAIPPWHSRSEMRRMATQTPQALIAEIDRLTVLVESYRDSKLGYRQRMLEHGETIGRLTAERDAMRAALEGPHGPGCHLHHERGYGCLMDKLCREEMDAALSMVAEAAPIKLNPEADKRLADAIEQPPEPSTPLREVVATTPPLGLIAEIDRLTAELAAAVCSTCNGGGRRERRGYTGRLIRGAELCPDCDNGALVAAFNVAQEADRPDFDWDDADEDDEPHCCCDPGCPCDHDNQGGKR